MAKHFSGIMVPVMTPFDEKGCIDESAYRKHLLFLLKSGIHGVLVPSGTGEFPNLTWEEKSLLIRITSDVIGGKIPIVSLVSDCSTNLVLKFCEEAKKAGSDEVMVTPPYFSHINQDALINMFVSIANSSELPVWLYHQPGETKLTIAPESVIELSKHPNIVGIKIAAGDDFFYFSRIMQLLKGNERFSILMGEDFATLPSYLIGGDGSVSSLANIIPEDFVNIWDFCQEGKYIEAKKIHEKIMDCFDAMILVDTGNYQSACKAVLKVMGYYSTNIVSSPFIEISEKEKKDVLLKSKKLGLIP